MTVNFDTLISLFLFTGQEPTYIAIILLGCTFYKKDQTFWHASILLLFTTIFSTTLKHIFLVPLDPSLNMAGYAFPSGHMQAEVAFYGWILWKTSYRWVKIIIPILLIANGWAMIQRKYHTFDQEMAGLAFSLILIALYQKGFYWRAFDDKSEQQGWFLWILSLPMIGFLHIFYTVPFHVWKGFFALTSFLIFMTAKKKYA